jgi:predicted nucleic acid-binding Zn ribbon protein
MLQRYNSKLKPAIQIHRCNEIQNKNKLPQYKFTLTMYAVNAEITE